MRAAVYLRQSKDPKDDKLAISRQREDCVKLCEERGWTWKEYPDNDRSASNGARPAYHRMLDDIRAGQIDAVVTWDLDRLHRKPIELEEFMLLAESKKIALATVGGETDLSTDGGRLFARIKGAVAKAEVERKSARQKRANQQQREAGVWRRGGIRPFGYTQDGEPLEPQASCIRQAAVDVLAGHSLRSVAVEWINRDIPTVRGGVWTNLAVRRILKNPVYAGLVTHQGKVVGPGAWEAIIDEDTHDRLRSLLSDPSRKPAVSFERKHMGSGVYQCAVCAGKLYGAYPHGPNRRMLYICRKSVHVARNGEMLDRYVTELVLGHLNKYDVGAELRDNSERQINIRALRTEQDVLQARADELATLFSKGEIKSSQLVRGTAELNIEMSRIDTELAEVARVSPLAAMALADGEDTLAQRWEAASADIRGKIVAELMEVIVHPAPRGVTKFDYDLIETNWRH